MLTPLRAFLAVSLVLLFGATLAAAPTADEIDAGARRAGKGLKGVVRKLASDRFEGRNNGSEGSLLSQELLVKKLSKFADGLAPGGSYLQPFTRNTVSGTNVLAVIPGRELPDEYVIIGAHYDHLGITCETTASDPGDIICNGAQDNASGSAAVLAVGKALAKLKEPPRRSVVLAFWDAEEDGLQGSAYYVSDPLVPLEDTVAYVNVDGIATALTPSLRNNTVVVGTETGGAVLRAILDAAVAAQTLDYTFFSYAFGQERSDYANFGNPTVRVPTAFFADATTDCYHTTGDELREVDFKKLAQQSAVAFRTVLALAEAEVLPVYVEPGTPLVSFEDAVGLGNLIERSIPADLPLFSPDAQTALLGIQDVVETIVAEGAAEFGEEDGGAILVRAGALVERLTDLECPSF
jgi:hypothetical protein